MLWRTAYCLPSYRVEFHASAGVTARMFLPYCWSSGPVSMSRLLFIIKGTSFSALQN